MEVITGEWMNLVYFVRSWPFLGSNYLFKESTFKPSLETMWPTYSNLAGPIQISWRFHSAYSLAFFSTFHTCSCHSTYWLWIKYRPDAPTRIRPDMVGRLRSSTIGRQKMRLPAWMAWSYTRTVRNLCWSLFSGCPSVWHGLTIIQSSALSSRKFSRLLVGRKMHTSVVMGNYSCW